MSKALYACIIGAVSVVVVLGYLLDKAAFKWQLVFLAYLISVGTVVVVDIAGRFYNDS